MSEGELSATLKSLGLKPNRRLGQHFLKDDNIAAWMVERAGIEASDTVLEIGPGLGVLTKHLLAKTRNVVAVERDQVLARYLEDKLGIGIITGDALRVDLPAFDKVVSNLPYQISSGITVRLLEKGFDSATLMFQKEFADHLVAPPGTASYSRISVMTQYRASASIIKKVPKGCFHPPPKVDSAIVRIEPRKPDYRIESEETFQLVVRALFSHKNRKVRNGLVSEYAQLGIEKTALKDIAASLPHADERPVKLSPAELAEITNEYHRVTRDGAYFSK